MVVDGCEDVVGDFHSYVDWVVFFVWWCVVVWLCGDLGYLVVSFSICGSEQMVVVIDQDVPYDYGVFDCWVSCV